MAAAKRKGYRAAIDYAARLPEPERPGVTSFLSWFYDRAPTRIVDDVTRTAEQRQREQDEAMTNPDHPDTTARDEARRLTASAIGRNIALGNIDQRLLALRDWRTAEPARPLALATEYDTDADTLADEQRIAYWEAVRRLVAYALDWRVT